MGKIICFVNRKGGSGKTTTVFNLAGALVEMGHWVLVIDMDPQGSFSRSLRVYPDGVGLSALLALPSEGFRDLIHLTSFEGLSVVPSDPDLRTFEFWFSHQARRRSALKQCLNGYLPRDAFDFVFIDCPPSLNLLTSNALIAAEEAIIPVDGSTYTIDALNDTMESIRLVQKRANPGLKVLGILITNVDQSTIFDSTIEKTLRDYMGDLVFETVIPTSTRVGEAAQMGRPITFYARAHSLAHRYRELAREFVKGLEKSG